MKVFNEDTQNYEEYTKDVAPIEEKEGSCALMLLIYALLAVAIICFFTL
jgi:hypothetical protein